MSAKDLDRDFQERIRKSLTTPIESLLPEPRPLNYGEADVPGAPCSDAFATRLADKTRQDAERKADALNRAHTRRY